MNQAAVADRVGGRTLLQDPSLGIGREQPLLLEQDVEVDVGMHGRHAVIAHHRDYRRLQVERREQPRELAVDVLPHPRPRRFESVPPFRGETRLAGVGELPLLLGLVDDRHVAHQQVPVGALGRGEQSVAEETGEAAGLLEPSREIDPRPAVPGFDQAVVVRRTGPEEPPAGERGGESSG